MARVNPMGCRMRLTCLFLAVVATLSLAVREATARLGETFEQCNQRYGAPSSSTSLFPVLAGAPNRQYNYQGWRISVAFLKGQAAKLRYSKLNSGKIEEDEFQAIIKGNAGGGSWSAQSTQKTIFNNPFGPNKIWSHSNGSVAYFENPSRNTVILEAPIVQEFLQAQAAKREQQRKDSIPEF